MNVSSIKRFLIKDIWLADEKKMNFSGRFAVRNLKMLMIAIRGFIEDKCTLRASALTFFTLLSIVPVAALFFGIAKGFGIDRKVEEILSQKFSNHQEILDYVLQFSNSLLNNTKGGLVAGVGLILLLWSVMKLLNNIEKSFNDIWEIKKSRSFIRKFSDYFSLMFFAPIMVMISSSLTVFLTSQLHDIIQGYSFLGFLSPFVMFLFKIIPYIIIWLLLTLIYMIMPNTKVQFKSALIAGIIAGTIFQLVQWGYVKFQIGVANYNTIYGSFAALPLFLVWVQLSWLIVLFGAEISFARQNLYNYEFDSEKLVISYNLKKKIALLIAFIVVDNFSKGEKPLTASQISERIEVPIRVVRQIIYELAESGVVSEIRTDSEKVFAYQPAMDIHLLTYAKIIELFDKYGKDDISIPESSKIQHIESTLERFNKLIEASDENKKIKEL